MTKTLEYTFPDHDTCVTCHGMAIDDVLGPKTNQLNREYDYDGVVENQLRAMSEIALLDFGSTEPLDVTWIDVDSWQITLPVASGWLVENTLEDSVPTMTSCSLLVCNCSKARMARSTFLFWERPPTHNKKGLSVIPSRCKTAA